MQQQTADSTATRGCTDVTVSSLLLVFREGQTAQEAVLTVVRQSEMKVNFSWKTALYGRHLLMEDTFKGRWPFDTTLRRCSHFFERSV